MPGGQRSAEKLELIASLRRQIRILEAEASAVIDDQTDVDSIDPHTLKARERLLTEAEGAARVGCWAWHVPSNSVYWSDEMFRITGVDPHQHGDL